MGIDIFFSWNIICHFLTWWNYGISSPVFCLLETKKHNSLNVSVLLVQVSCILLVHLIKTIYIDIRSWKIKAMTPKFANFVNLFNHCQRKGSGYYQTNHTDCLTQKVALSKSSRRASCDIWWHQAKITYSSTSDHSDRLVQDCSNSSTFVIVTVGDIIIVVISISIIIIY